MLKCVFFLGAGASVPFGIPTMTEMVANFEVKTNEPNYGLGYVVQEIKNRLKDYRSFDIEALITVLQDIINYDTVAETIFDRPSLYFYTPTEYRTFVSSVRSLGNRYQNEAKQMLADVKNFVIESCSFKDSPFEIYTELFSRGHEKYGWDYGQKIRLGRTKGIENIIFTTNYDLVLEAYCSHLGLTYENGEKHGGILSLRSDNVELYSVGMNLHQICKLHGSINWYTDEHGTMRWSSEPVKTGKTTSLGHKVEKELLIYPAFTKYTFREPFYTMFHQLRYYLVTCNRCYIVGYSFRDEDILGLFHDAMMVNKSLLLTIIDPMAETIARDKFALYEGRISCISEAFSVKAAEKLSK
jgi:hypothetical protein